MRNGAGGQQALSYVTIIRIGGGYMGCPMKAGACEKYGITPDQQKRFCKKGCSVICEEEFIRMCEKQQKVDDEKNNEGENYE